MNNLVKSTLSVLTLLLSTLSIWAQPNSSSLFEDVTDTPVNAGIALMAAAGIGYGFKQLKKRKK